MPSLHAAVAHVACVADCQPSFPSCNGQRAAGPYLDVARFLAEAARDALHPPPEPEAMRFSSGNGAASALPRVPGTAMKHLACLGLTALLISCVENVTDPRR